MSALSPDDRLLSPEEEELSQLQRMADGIGSFGAGIGSRRGANLFDTKKSIYDNDAQLDRKIRDKPPRYMGHQNSFGIKMKFTGKMAKAP